MLIIKKISLDIRQKLKGKSSQIVILASKSRKLNPRNTFYLIRNNNNKQKRNDGGTKSQRNLNVIKLKI